jgi:hypothetical protein
LLNLKRAMGGSHTKAIPLPDVWTGLAGESIKFRRGQVCMVAAAPNAGKSMFALVYAIRAKVPTLFFSADTDTATVLMRSAAQISGHTQLTVESNISEQSEYGSPSMPPPRRAIHGKVSQLPALILTLGYDPGQGMLRVAAVKNRFGPHTADASKWATLFVNFAACQIGDQDAQGRAYLRV